MACMHKKTFKILHNDYLMLPDDYVQIDELIAPVIQVLNRKGYITRFCCSGHPLDDWLAWLTTEDGVEYRETMSSSNSSIAFEEGITLPVLPPGFDVVPNPRSLLEIRKSYYIDNAFDNQFYERARSILETMKQLYEWALDLPDFPGL